MAKIKNKDAYGDDLVITGDDYLVGSDADTPNKITKSYKLSEILAYVQNNIVVTDSCTAPTGTGTTIEMSKCGGSYNIAIPSTGTLFTLTGDVNVVNAYVYTRTRGAAVQPQTTPASVQEGGVQWNNTDEFQMLIYRDSEGLKHRFDPVDIAIGTNAGVVRNIKVTITPSQLINLVASPVTLIPAPGAGKLIKVLDVTTRMVFNSVAFVGGSVDISHPSSLSLWTVPTSAYQVSSGTELYRLDKNGSDRQVYENEEIQLKATANPNVGDSNLDVYLSYEIVTL